jgi:hypothetical protein
MKIFIKYKFIAPDVRVIFYIWTALKETIFKMTTEPPE